MAAALAQGAGEGPPGTGWLSAATGLSGPTVRKGLAELASAGFAGGAGQGAAVSVPADLVQDRAVPARARALYGCLMLTRGYYYPHGQLTIAELAGLARIDPKTATKAVADLAKSEWLRVDRAHRLDRIHIQLTYPGFERGLNAIAAAQVRLGRSKHRGEGLMREFLSVLIDCEEFEDDAAPGWLVRPLSGEWLQLERFYGLRRVAFEFNGPQHYRATERFTAAEVALQRERDYVKMGICAERGITLVVILPEQLTLQQVQAMLPVTLPRRDLAGQELLIEFLEDQSREYRRRMARI